MARLLDAILTLVVLSSADAGKFSDDSRHFLIENLRRINPFVRYDETGYLVDRSAEYAKCSGPFAEPQAFGPVPGRTPDGATVAALVTRTRGSMTDYLSVQMYVRHAVDAWMQSELYHAEFSAAERVGCSTEAGCEGGFVVVGCLFTPDVSDPTDFTKDQQLGPQRAFTEEQYKLAESITGKQWDRTYFLENLASLETNCTLVGVDPGGWAPLTAQRVAQDWGVHVGGQFGYVPNEGDTQSALVDILQSFAANIPQSSSSNVGCSLIANCPPSNNARVQQDFVLVVCLFSADSAV